jgi:hypothetical protein
MSVKAVVVLKGDSSVSGTVHFEQTVNYFNIYLNIFQN